MGKTPDPILKVKDYELMDWIDAMNYVVNGGHYSFPLTTTVPNYQTDQGEQRIYSVTTGTVTDRRFYIYINGVWCVINFDSAGNVTGGTGGGGGDHIIDPDGNTLVHTNFTGGGAEDRVRFYSAGVYAMAVDTYGVQLPSEYKLVFNGLGGTTYWTYSTASTYLQAYIGGVLRMEM